MSGNVRDVLLIGGPGDGITVSARPDTNVIYFRREGENGRPTADIYEIVSLRGATRIFELGVHGSCATDADRALERLIKGYVPPRGEEWRVPTPAEQAAQAKACPCRGSDDMCPCQNITKGAD